MAICRKMVKCAVIYKVTKKNVSLIKENPELHSDYNEVKYEI